MWYEFISLVLNLLLGGGLVVTLVTLRATRRQADANAEKAAADAVSTELENVGSAIEIWRKLAENQTEQYNKVLEELDKLRREVSRLNRINSKIVKLLDKITHENMEIIVEQIKKELQDENNTTLPRSRDTAPDLL